MPVILFTEDELYPDIKEENQNKSKTAVIFIIYYIFWSITFDIGVIE